MGVEMFPPDGRCCPCAPQGGQDAVPEVGLGWVQAAPSWSNRAQPGCLCTREKGNFKATKNPQDFIEMQ